MIELSKPYLPPIEKYNKYVEQIFNRAYLTNGGPLVQRLEKKLEEYLGVKNLILVNNGTMALNLAYHLLELRGEVITTPFSFVATTSSLVWQGLKPRFADIDPSALNLDPKNLRSTLTSKTSAILPVHVFGNPCEVEKLQEFSDENNLKLIYDAAHAFAVRYKGESLLRFGDVSALSFHATKLFHTIEGGALIIKSDELYEKAKCMTNFGYEGSTINYIGSNAKMNEFSAAMGLCVLDEMDAIISDRKRVYENYVQELNGSFEYPKITEFTEQNYGYFPILLETHEQLLKIERSLFENGIVTRRYFNPSLDELCYLKGSIECVESRRMALRTLCLPQYAFLLESDQQRVLDVIKRTL